MILPSRSLFSSCFLAAKRAKENAGLQPAIRVTAAREMAGLVHVRALSAQRERKPRYGGSARINGRSGTQIGTVCVFRRKFALEDVIGSHACSA
jgi:hypothetical protein